VDLICQNYKNHRKAGLSVFLVGEEYYSRANEAKNQGNQEQAQANFQKAIAIWDKNINQIPDPVHQAMANYFTAVSYKYLNDYRKSIAHYQKVFSEFPESEYAAHSLFMVGRNYEKLSRIGGRSAVAMVLETRTDPNEVVSTVDPNSVTTPVEVSGTSVNTVRAAYKLLVEKYPDSPGAKYARKWLKKRNSR
jgi:tetratricopeptide (TPR) repeat protein